VAVYTGPPLFMIYRGVTWLDAPWVWASSFIGLFLLFVAQTIVAERKRYRNRGPAAKGKGKKRKRA
jgi:hypothetical protein